MNRPLTKEFGDLCDSDFPKVIPIETRYIKKRNGDPMDLHIDEITPGYEVAGSCARWIDGGFAVWFSLDGRRMGKRHTTLAEALRHFNRFKPL